MCIDYLNGGGDWLVPLCHLIDINWIKENLDFIWLEEKDVSKTGKIWGSVRFRKKGMRLEKLISD